MRTYEPVWSRLKRDKVVSITANRLLHARIIKAVTKEKWLDLGFKMEIAPRIAKLTSTVQGSIITFKLDFYLGTIGEQDI